MFRKHKNCIIETTCQQITTKFHVCRLITRVKIVFQMIGQSHEPYEALYVSYWIFTQFPKAVNKQQSSFRAILDGYSRRLKILKISLSRTRSALVNPPNSYNARCQLPMPIRGETETTSLSNCSLCRKAIIRHWVHLTLLITEFPSTVQFV